VLTSRCGVRQGDPLGPALFALGLHPLLCGLQLALRAAGYKILIRAYADDIHVLGSPEAAAAAFSLLAGPPGAAHSLASLGLEAVPAKSDVWAPWLSYLPGAPAPAGVHTALPAGEAARLRDRHWHSIPVPLRGALHCTLPEDGPQPQALATWCAAYRWLLWPTCGRSCTSACGACPVGDARQMALYARADTAPSDCVLGIVAGLDDLLLSGPGPAHHERARLLASYIQPRFGHFARTVPAECRGAESANRRADRHS
jgi:hypothetical protein